MPTIEEELTFFEFAEKFLNLNDMKTPVNLDISSLDIEIESLLNDGTIGFRPMNSFIVKDKVDYHYRVDELSGTSNHEILFGNEYVSLSEHPESIMVDEQMHVVDTSVEETENYIANGQVNHNTTPGGVAIPFHASVRIRLGKGSQIKNKKGEVIGINVSAKTIKNKVAPPFRSCDFEIHFGVGIKEHEQITDLLRSEPDVSYKGKTYSVEGTGAWKVLSVTNDKTGEVLVEKKFTKSGMENLLNNKEYSKYLDIMLEQVLVRKMNESDPEVDIESYEEVRAIAIEMEEGLK